MQTWFTLFVLFFVTSLSAQNTRTIQRVDETFSVLEADSTIKHGPYMGYFEGKRMAEGRYQNGQRVGQWTFYGFDRKPAQVYDYDKQELTYTSAVADSSLFRVIQGTDTVWTTLDSKAEPIGGDMAVAQFLRSRIRYPERAKAMGIEGTVTILVTIDETGKSIHFRVTKLLGGGCDEEAVWGIKRMPQPWVPSKKDGKPVKSIVPLSVEFKLI